MLWLSWNAGAEQKSSTTWPILFCLGKPRRATGIYSPASTRREEYAWHTLADARKFFPAATRALKPGQCIAVELVPVKARRKAGK